MLQKAGTKLDSSLQEYTEYTLKHTQKHMQVTQLFRNLCCLFDPYGNNKMRGNLVENNAFFLIVLPKEQVPPPSRVLLKSWALQK